MTVPSLYEDKWGKWVVEKLEGSRGRTWRFRTREYAAAFIQAMDARCLGLGDPDGYSEWVMTRKHGTDSDGREYTWMPDATTEDPQK